jgi:hypothetical protein
MVELTQKEIASVDAAYWAFLNQIRLEGGAIFGPKGHEFQFDIMQSLARHICVMKAAQMTITTIFILRSLHGLIHGLLPNGVIYYFPTTRSVEKFSKTRFGPLIKDNYCIRKHLKNTNSVFVKRVGDSNLSFEGCSATMDIQGKKDSTAVRSTPADIVIRDERDLFSESMAEQTNQRTQHSLIQGEVDLGTPTMPDWGIHKLWQKSSQNHWMIKCQKCNEYTCLDTEFPACIHYRKDIAFRACKKCGSEIFPSDGQWVAKYPSRWDSKNPNLGICGFWPTQLISSYIDLTRMMIKYNDPDTNKGEFYNAILGLPYIDATDRLLISDVYSCCTNDRMLMGHPGPCAMGIDNDVVKHIVIGYRTGKKYVIVKVVRTSDKKDIHDLMRRFHVRSAVIDALPNLDSARELQVTYRNRLYMCFYSTQQAANVVWNLKEGIVKVNRTEAFDDTHRLVVDGFMEIPEKSSEIEMFANQVCNAAKCYETNDITGTQKCIYRKMGDDHYRNALNYFKVACRKIGRVAKDGVYSRQERVISDYTRI